MLKTGFKTRPYRQKRLMEYAKRMSTDDNHVQFDNNVASMLRNQGYNCEESPRSIYSVDKLYEALEKFAPGKVPDPVLDDDLKRGIALARASFSKPSNREYLHVLPFTPETIVAVTSSPTASAGLTNYGCSKAESMTRALERGMQTLHKEKAPEPCIAYKRTQFDDKTRLIWGYPYSMTVIEGLLAKPLYDEFKDGTTPMAFGMATQALGTRIRVASYHSAWAYSIDMSSFDANVSAYLIHQSFNILRSWYDLNEIEPVSGVSVREIFNLVEYYFIHTPIVMPNLKIYLGKGHGVPSGSFFTQPVDSIANVIIVGTIAHHFKMNVSKDEISVLGDDLIMFSNRKIDVKLLADFAQKKFGVRFNSKKSRRFHYSEPIHYLGRIWKDGVPDLDVDEIIKRMYYPETYRRYSKDRDKLQREVRMLILSYASIYKSAYLIARDALWTDLWHKQGVAGLDANVYLHCEDHDVNSDFLSGLERYLRKYVRDPEPTVIPNTAVQFWL